MSKKIFFHPARCMRCKFCVLACQMNAAGIENLYESRNAPNPGQRLKITFANGTPWVWKCQQCESAPCVEACVTGGLRKDEGTGTIVQNRDACVGCGSCFLACPIEGFHFESEDTKTTKCDLCLEKDTPPCVYACPTKALVYENGERFTRKKQKAFAMKLKRVC